MADRAGIGQASVSRIENGHQVPSLPQVRAWTQVTEATPQTVESLTALTEAAFNEVDNFRTRMRSGLPSMQNDVATSEAIAKTLRVFQPALVPGLLQIPEYARKVFEIVDVLDDGDHTGATEARGQRQRILYDDTHTLEFLITEPAIRWRIAAPSVMATQADHIASVAQLDYVTVGVIPTGAEIEAITWGGFDISEDFDDSRPPFVSIETPHAELTVSDPTDVNIYQYQLKLLRRSAVYGNTAHELLTRVATEMRHTSQQP